MAPGTRSNPERSETSKSGNDVQNAEVVSGSPVLDDERSLSLLNDGSDHVNQSNSEVNQVQSEKTEYKPALENIESILSKLAVVVERMQKDHSSLASNQERAV